MANNDLTDPNWISTEPAGHWLASQHLADASAKTEFRIDGWLAATGPCVWFGAGSTGKTQLLLWMAATIASTARPAQWLGREVHGTGHVLILTAEDSREHVIGRLRDIMLHTMGQDEATAEATCNRLHVMPFLSMTEDDFKHPNASLMQMGADRSWEPTGVLKEIRRYIDKWNEHAAAEDKIVGVIMDSATSMAGFDSIDGYATTNFFFYLGRMCEKLRIFWTVIGHQPKSVTIGRDTRQNAAARLRGAAMWTTAPRMTVEVRLIQEWGKAREADHIRAAYPDRGREDFVVVYVAKANLMGVQRDERYLLRSGEGAFTDVTMPAPETSPTVAAPKKQEPANDDAAGSSAKGSRDWDRGTALVIEMMRELYPDANSKTVIAAAKLYKHRRTHWSTHQDAALVTSPNGGDLKDARVGSTNWHLDRLVERGMLRKDDSRFYFVQWTGGFSADDGDIDASIELELEPAV